MSWLLLINCMFRGSTRFTDIVYIFSSYFFISSPLFNFVFVLYVFTAAFCQQFIKEYDDDDDDVIIMSYYEEDRGRLHVK